MKVDVTFCIWAPWLCEQENGWQRTIAFTHPHRTLDLTRTVEALRGSLTDVGYVVDSEVQINVTPDAVNIW
jgi:hypothetical protein